MPKPPSTEKLVAAARHLARELEPQTHYSLPDLQTVIYSLLVYGIAEADVPDKVRLAAEADRLSASFSRKRKPGDYALWSLEVATRIQATKAMRHTASREGWSEAKRLYGRGGILHGGSVDVDAEGRISVEERP